MEPNTKYKIEDEPNLLQALIDDLDEQMADSSQIARIARRMNDRAFDIRRKLISVKNENTSVSGDANSAR